MTSPGHLSSAKPYCRVQPGAGVALAHSTLFLLMDSADDTTAPELWTLMESDCGIDRLLEEIGARMAGLRHFALASLEDGLLRIVVRGSATAEVSGGGKPTSIRGNGVKTWVESVFKDVASFELNLGTPADGPMLYRFDSGFVPAAVLRWSPGTSLTSAPASPTQASEADHADTSAPSRPSETPVAGDEEHTIDDIVSPSADEATIAPDTEDVLASNGEDPGSSAADAAPAAEVAPYSELYGSTVARSVQDAAVVVLDEPEEAPEVLDAVLLGSDPPSTPVAHVSQPADADRSTAIIDAIPASLVEVQSVPQASTSDPMLGDHDGHTMARSELVAAIRRPSGSDTDRSNAPDRPSVNALLCVASGHPNPPHYTECRACGAALEPNQVLISRPIIGVLQFSSGQVVELDRPVIVGRNPKVAGGFQNEMPLMVRLDVGDSLSRSHMAIHISGWTISLEDLDSSNGTFVTQPGGRRQRLHAGHPVALQSGAVVDLGGAVSAKFAESM